MLAAGRRTRISSDVALSSTQPSLLLTNTVDLFRHQIHQFNSFVFPSCFDIYAHHGYFGTFNEDRHARFKPVESGNSSEQSGYVGGMLSHTNYYSTHFLFIEYVLSTMDKIVNWARQSSMWPMTFGALHTSHPFFSRGYNLTFFRYPRFGVLCSRNDAYGSCSL